MAITISEKAATRVRDIKRRMQAPEAILRVGVRGGGCSGLEYWLDLVEAPQPNFGELLDKITLKQLK